MLEKLKEIKEKWQNELSVLYGGELEVNYFDGSYYVCAFHNEPKDGCDSWVEKLKEFDCLGNNEDIEIACHKLGIAICH